MRHEPGDRHFSDDESQPANLSQPRGTGWTGLKNLFLQVAALYAPGRTTARVWLHRKRGVRIGENVIISLSVIVDGEYAKLVSIGDNVYIGARTAIVAHLAGVAMQAKGKGELSVLIADNVYIGPGVIILPNVSIGDGAVVTAGSVVNASVPPMTMVQGNPAMPVARCGIPLVGNAYEQFIFNLKPM
jgi:acetyltransferase-like isoleucine patch superfamily enzyme